MDEAILFVLAGKIPDDIRQQAKDPTKIVAAFTNFRKSIVN